MTLLTTHNDDYIIRLPDVIRITGLSRAVIYQQISDGAFPKQIKLSTRASGWLNSEIQSWLQARVLERDTGGSYDS